MLEKTVLVVSGDSKEVKMRKVSKLCTRCQHKKEKCRMLEGEKCIRYMPCDNTNFIQIGGVVETPPEIDEDIFSQQFINWIESMGYYFGGGISNANDD